MPDAVIVSTARTPIGKAFRGAFNMTHGAVLGGPVVTHAVERAGVDPGEVEDVVMGCSMSEPASRPRGARQRAGMLAERSDSWRPRKRAGQRNPRGAPRGAGPPRGDEGTRPDTAPEGPAALAPVRAGGFRPAGNASQLSDGASA